MRKTVLILSVVALSACAVHPKPPTVNGKDRHPVNDAQTNEVLSLQAQNAQLQKALDARSTGSKPAWPAPTAPLASSTPAAPPTLAASSSITRSFVVHFAYGSADFSMPADLRAELYPAAFTAFRIEVRGRTDGKEFSPADERVAFRRATAARDYLVSSGVPASKIFINYVSGGDYAVNNQTAAGQAQNRRVEILVSNVRQ